MGQAMVQQGLEQSSLMTYSPQVVLSGHLPITTFVVFLTRCAYIHICRS